MSDVPTKRCSKCGEELPATAEFFNRQKDGKYGLRGECKRCGSERSKRYYQEHREQLIEYQHAYCEEHREEVLERKRKYYEDNKERLLAYSHERYFENRDAMLAYSKRYREDHADRKREIDKQYAATHRKEKSEYDKRYRERNHARRISQNRQYYYDNRNDILERRKQWAAEHPEVLSHYSATRRARKRGNGGKHTADDVRAQYDRQHGRCFYCGRSVKHGFHVDHVIPLARGGSNGPENLVVACPTCNLQKRDKHPMDWCGRMF